MIGALYNDKIIEKARKIVAEAKEFPMAERENYCRNRVGLSYSYLCRVGTMFKKPSARVLMNLGYEVYVKDIATGEMSLLELDVPCDWNPSNPRLNPDSTPVYVASPSGTSTTSE